jgi:serine/threonine-protein kinase
MASAAPNGRFDAPSGAPPAGATDPAPRSDAAYACLDCDTRFGDAEDQCSRCGGIVVALIENHEPEHDPLIGRKIGGRFSVLARLGAGSMGSVYRAKQEGMAREVALKVLKPERALDAASVQRFEREARATSALTSPHTVTVFDFGEDESMAESPLLYLAMERLDGESLGQRLKNTARLTSTEAVKIAQQVLRSLAEAHEKGIVHRDLKPDNIFLHKVPTPHGLEETVKVLDFGIAKVLQPDMKVDSLETQAGTVFGTPRYMSPEQAQSKPLDGRSDLYTVGLILFQMVTGRHCFPDEDAVVVMARHIQSLPPRPREVAPDAGISRRLEAVILRTLAKDPRRRPQSALELHDELEAAMSAPDLRPSESLSVAAPAVTSSASIDPVADVSGANAAQDYDHIRKQRARKIALGLGFLVMLIGAVGLGARLATGSSSGTSTYTAGPSESATKAPTEPMATVSASAAEPKPKASESAAAVTSSPKTTWRPPPTKPSATTAATAPTATAPEPPPPADTATAKPPPKKPPGYGKFE